MLHLNLHQCELNLCISHIPLTEEGASSNLLPYFVNQVMLVSV